MSEESVPSRFALSMRIGIAVVLVLFLFGAWRPVVRSLDVIRNFPYQLDREEGFLFNQAIVLANGGSIYTSIESPPWLVGNYTPFYPAVYAASFWVAEPGMAVGRAIVLLAALGLALTLALVVRRLSGSWFSGALMAAIFLSTYDLNQWVVFARVDLPALFLTGLGILLFVESGKKWNAWTECTVWTKWMRFAAALVFVAAVYTKQTQILAPIAIMGALAISGDRRGALYFAASFVGGCAVVGLTLLAATGGQFWLHTVTYNANKMDWGQLLVWLRHLWRFEAFLILALPLAAWVCVGRLGLKDPSRTNRLFVLLYGALGILSLATIAKAGAAANYLLEYHLAVLLLLGTGLGILAQQMPNRPRLTCALGFVMVALLALHGIRTNFTWVSRAIFPTAPAIMEREGFDALLLRIADAEGPVLTEDPVLNILAGKEVLYQPFIMAELAREGKWDPTPLITRIDNREFGLLVTEKDLEADYFFGFTKETRDAILANYALETTVRVGPSVRYVYRRGK